MKKFFLLASSVIFFLLLSPSCFVKAIDYSKVDAGWVAVYSTSKYVEYNPAVIVSADESNLYWYFNNSAGEIKLKFYGTRFRIITSSSSNAPDNCLVTVSDSLGNVIVSDTFSNKSDYVKYYLAYEKTGLSLDNYIVTLTPGSINSSDSRFFVMRFDIGDNGQEGFYIAPDVSSDVDMSDTNVKLDYIYGAIIWFCIVSLALFFLFMFYKILCYFF